MKESHRKDLASHPDPESCASGRKANGEALTGAHTGQQLSCEIESVQGADAVVRGGRQHGKGEKGEPNPNPAQSKNLCMYENSSHGNREVPAVPLADGARDRPEKVNDRNSGMYVAGKSDRCIVPGKSPNKDLGSAEVMEVRRLTKGNTGTTATFWTQSQANVSTGLACVQKAAKEVERTRFTALMHHITPELLRDSFHLLKRKSAAGVDGVTWADYEIDFNTRIVDLHQRIHRGTYRAQPSKRAYIPKPYGKLRPLGIAALEDKIVQMAVVLVLNCVYENDFVGFSYGFRPARSAHDALDSLWMGIMRKKVGWVLDADIQGFFDTINHEWMIKFLEHRIADRRIIRLIQKWLRAGVSEDGKWVRTNVGTPQGAVISPLLANVFLHYVLDLWAHHWRTKSADGDVIIVRYADDFILGFQHRHEAERFLKELKERLTKFGLALHPNKTRLIEFGRFAAKNRANRREGKPETFDFLGFKHICGRTLESRKFYLRRLTIKKRLALKLKEIRGEMLRRRHLPLQEQTSWLRSVIQGYNNFYAIPGNSEALKTFRREVTRSWLFALQRRSQRRRPIRWRWFGPYANRWLPHFKILHPYPNERFRAKHPK